MSLQEAASQVGRRATKFCPANVQKIKDFVAQGISRHEIAELLDVPLGSLQVTCSRLGISLRRPKVENGKKTITMHDPIAHNGRALSQPIEEQSQENSRSGTTEPAPAAKPQQEHVKALEAGLANVAIRIQYKGTERTTELPLTLGEIARLACEAEFRDMTIGQFIGKLIEAMVTKDLFPVVLDKP